MAFVFRVSVFRDDSQVTERCCYV